jgi:hypothetical protein
VSAFQDYHTLFLMCAHVVCIETAVNGCLRIEEVSRPQ